MTEKKEKRKNPLTDNTTVLYKLATYGVALVLILLAIFVIPNGENLDPKWGWLIIAFLLYYVLISRKILETLLLGMALGVALQYGTDFMNGLQTTIYSQMESEDFVWIVLMCGLLNVFNVLLSKAGSNKTFSEFIARRAKDAKQLNFLTWLFQFPLFFDDYMTISVGGNVMTPIYDEKKVPREECAFLVHSLAEPLRVLLPITSWAGFMAGVFESGGLTGGLQSFWKSIPFSFYAIVAEVGTLLFALGVLPKLGAMKHPDPSKYEKLVVDEDAAEKKGSLLDFFIPLAFLIVVAGLSGWDVVPALIIVLPCMFAYYMIRGLIGVDDIEGSLVDGLASLMNMNVLFLASYGLAAVLNDTGYISYLVSVASQVINPHLLPFLLFVVFSISEASMSLNWSLILIAFPVIIPLAQSIGANVYLTTAAVISAGCFGCNLCYICDYTSLTGKSCGLKPDYHASTCVPYSLIFAAVTAVLYLVCGFVI